MKITINGEQFETTCEPASDDAGDDAGPSSPAGSGCITMHVTGGAAFGAVMVTLAQLQAERELSDLLQLQSELLADEQAAGEPFFLGLPDYWYEIAHWRCTRGHVSAHYIKSDTGDRCPACLAPCVLTFPGDVDDPDAGWVALSPVPAKPTA